jgi:formylglycine-generating enzyme required for sulfatase activity
MLFLPKGVVVEYALAREHFEGLIAPLIARTVQSCRQLVTGADLAWAQVDRVLLVGGSCRIPYVEKTLQRELDRPTRRAEDLEVVVALGAALHGERPARDSLLAKDDAVIAVERLPFEPQLVTIPAGPFLMGTPRSEFDELLKLWAGGLLSQLFLQGDRRKRLERETPQHAMTLGEYAIARYPITNAEFAHFIEAGGYAQRDYWTEAGWQQKEAYGWTHPRRWHDERFNTPSQPVVGVSWYEAVAYCRWLSAKSGKSYRLPTEAEWEKAARGTDGRRYPWGNRWNAALCNNGESGPGATTPVGQYSPAGDSPYGCADMAGNVWEWCSSLYQPYPYERGDGRENLEEQGNRVLRGGSWYNDNPAWVRCASRDGDLPGLNYGLLGFRVARSSRP